MTEEEAETYLASLDVPCGTSERWTSFGAMLREEAARQNLVSVSSLEHLLSRHVADSAQLLSLAPEEGSWIDVGTGAGLPGIVVAAARVKPMILVEPRQLRAAFLQRVARSLDLTHVSVEQKRVEQVRADRAAVISARAVAALPALLDATHHLADEATVWLLPKGIHARDEVEAARRSWQGEFRLVPSITNPAAAIVVARGVKRKDGR